MPRQGGSRSSNLRLQWVRVFECTSRMPNASNIDPALPFIDLHRHLDGSIRLETIIDLARQNDIELPGKTVEEIRPHVQVMEPQPGLMAFIAKMLWGTQMLVNGEA